VGEDHVCRESVADDEEAGCWSLQARRGRGAGRRQGDGESGARSGER
jgi:hypothetical protein